MVTRYVFTAAFLAVWLEGVTFFYVYDRTLRSSSPVPTAEHSVALNNKGVTVYVTPAEMRLIDQLRDFMFIGIPSMIATAFFLQYVLKIRYAHLKERAGIQPRYRRDIGLNVATAPRKSRSFSVATVHPFATAVAAMIMSVALRGRPVAVPSAIRRAHSAAARSSKAKIVSTNIAFGPLAPSIPSCQLITLSSGRKLKDAALDFAKRERGNKEAD